MIRAFFVLGSYCFGLWKFSRRLACLGNVGDARGYGVGERRRGRVFRVSRVIVRILRFLGILG